MLESIQILIAAVICESLVFPTLSPPAFYGGERITHPPYTVLGIRWIVKVAIAPCEVITHLLYMIAIPFALLWAMFAAVCVAAYLIVLGIQFIASGTIPDPIPFFAIAAEPFRGL